MPPGSKLGLIRLSKLYPWPKDRPSVPKDFHGWFSDEVKVKALQSLLSEKTQVVVELGSWLGMSTRLMLDAAPKATVIAIDHWKGNPEHQKKPEMKKKLPRLFETFLVNCWAYKDRLIPVKLSSFEGLKLVYDLKIFPDLILVDADHTYENVIFDLTLSHLFFSNAILVGDDWIWKRELNFPVRRAVKIFAKQYGFKIRIHKNLWIIDKSHTFQSRLKSRIFKAS